MDTRDSKFLPSDLHKRIYHYLNGNSIFSLANTSQYFMKIVQKDVELNRIYIDQLNQQARLNDALRRLLSHAALGEWDQAKVLWLSDPCLLTMHGTIYHPNRDYQSTNDPIDIPIEKNPGRYGYANLTAWQIAWMNEEYEIVEEMAKYMNDDEKHCQFAEIFPDGKLIHYLCDFNEAKKRLQAVFEAVINDASISEDNLDQMNDATRKALYELYHYIKPPREHTMGLVFDAKIYQEALRIFEDEFFEFQWYQLAFWRTRVEEYIAYLLGTNYLRPHSQTQLFTLCDKTGCELNDNSSYFAFRRSSHSLPGLHFFISVHGAATTINPVIHGFNRFEFTTFSSRMNINNERKDKILAAVFPHNDCNKTLGLGC